jgi:hypothetical protein
MCPLLDETIRRETLSTASTQLALAFCSGAGCWHATTLLLPLLLQTSLGRTAVA